MREFAETISAESQLPAISPKLRDRLTYPRLRKDTGTALMIDAEYFIQRECVNGFRQNGWKTVMLPLEPGAEFIQRLLMCVVDHQPDLLFTVNHLGFDQKGALSGLLESIGLPTVSWYVDSPPYILLDHGKNVSELTVTPIWERTYESFLRNFGFQHVFHLPLAGDPDLFKTRSRKSTQRYRVSFVGDSMVGATAKWIAKCPDFYGRNDLISAAVENISYRDRLVTDEALEKTARLLNISISSLTGRQKLTLQSAIVLEATRLRRNRLVEALGVDGAHIFGDDGWRSCIPPEVALHPGPDYYLDLPEIYASTEINLNSTSAQMPSAVNQRVFDVPLAGGFLLTDAQSDLDDLFAGDSEVITYDSMDELPEKVRYYGSGKGSKESVVRRAAERIVSYHTYRHRIAKIIQYAREVVGDRQEIVACAV